MVEVPGVGATASLSGAAGAGVVDGAGSVAAGGLAAGGVVGAIGSVCLLVMGLLGGSMVPRALMPPLMRKIGLMTPHAWALDGYHDILVRAGTGLGDVGGPIAAVAAFGAAFALVGSIRFRFER